MTYDEKILNYKMTEQDEELAKTAEVIIGTYNGSYKPHLIEAGVPMYVKHSPEGFSCISSDHGERIHTTDAMLPDFIEHVFLTIGGYKDITMKQVCESSAVKHALVKHFDFPTDIDFQAEGFIPVLFCGDNDFIVYHFNDGIWSKYNIVDRVRFKQRRTLEELLYTTDTLKVQYVYEHPKFGVF